MTRFELASTLSSRLYMLTESERHNIINKYVYEVNMQIEEGMEESAAVAQLGDINLLADRILARHHIDTSRLVSEPAEENNCPEETEADIKEAAENVQPVNEQADKISDLARTAAEKAGDTAKKTAGTVRHFISWIGKGTEKLTVNILNVFLFIFIWIPCMAITAAGVIFTVAITVIYLFSGIGFTGVCLAGAGCCIVGTAFCLWLGNALTGGKENG